MAKLYTVKALAELFQRHENTIYKWIVADHLFPHAFRVKDGWFVPSNDVKKIMQAETWPVNGDQSAGTAYPKPLRAGFVRRW